MVSQSTRASLLERLRVPDDDVAWREFDRRYRDLILRTCRRCGLQLADAEDVRQVVMMNLARAFPAFRYDRERGRFRGYLGRIVKNAISRHLGGGPQATGIPDRIDQVAAPADPDAAWEREWMLHHYRTALATLRSSVEPRSVEVFDALLRGGTVEGVARSRGLSEDAVQKIKQRMRDRLRDLVSAQVRDEDGDADPGPEGRA